MGIRGRRESSSQSDDVLVAPEISPAGIIGGTMMGVSDMVETARSKVAHITNQSAASQRKDGMAVKGSVSLSSGRQGEEDCQTDKLVRTTCRRRLKALTERLLRST